MSKLGGASLIAIAALAVTGSPAKAQTEDVVCVDAFTGMPILSQRVAAAIAGGAQIICGPGASASGDGAIATGKNASANGGNDTIAIGTRANTQSRPNGINPPITSGDAIAIGTDASVRPGTINQINGADRGIAIGKEALVTSTGSIALGAKAEVINTPNDDNPVPYGSIAIGERSRAIGGTAISIGSEAGRGSTGSLNLFAGTQSGMNTTGSGNVVFGSQAGQNVSGGANSAFGTNAGNNVGLLTDATIECVFSPFYCVGQGGNGSNNVGFGNRAGTDVNGALNIGIGWSGGYKVNGFNNIGIGPLAGFNVTGSGNIGMSTFAGSDVQGYFNTAIGHSAGTGVRGRNNSAFGYETGLNVVGDNNFASGNHAGTDVTGSDNFASGAIAGQSVTGNANLALGYDAGSVVTGDYNLASGYSTGQYVEGTNNVAIGREAGNGVAGDTLATNDTIAIGTTATAFGNEAIALGYQAQAGVNNDPTTRSIAIGAQSQATGQSAVALGDGAQANGAQSISIGTGNIVNGDRSGAIGDPTIIDATDSYSVGNNNNIAAGQTDVFALGNNITTTISNSIALGSNSAMTGAVSTRTQGNAATYTSDIILGQTRNFAGGDQVVGLLSLGNDTQTRRIQNLAPGLIGAASTDAINGSQLYAVTQALTHYYSTNDGGTIVGNYNNDGAVGLFSLASGTGALANGPRSVAVGNNAQTNSAGTVAVGNNAQALTNGTVSVGQNAGSGATNVGNFRVAIGDSAGTNVNGNTNTTVGAQSGQSVTGANNTALGYQAGRTVGMTGFNAMNNTAVGTRSGNNVNGSRNTTFGWESGSGVIGNDNLAFGGQTGINVLGARNIASGYYAGSGTQGSLNVASGMAAGVNVIGDGNVALGDHAGTSSLVIVGAGGQPTLLSSATLNVSNTVSLGRASKVGGDSATALGSLANATLANSVALGSGAVADTVISTASGTIAGITYTYAGTTPLSTVSVGAVGAERTITNVAAGRVSAASTDAINGSQLAATNDAVEDAILQAQGNTTALGGGAAYDPATNIYTAPSYVTSTGTYTNVGDAIVAGNTQTNALGNSVASGLGGTSAYDPVTGQVTTALTVGGTNYGDVNSALSAVNAQATAGWDVTTGATGSGIANGTSVANVAPGATHTITAGDNIIATQNGTEVQLAVNPDLNVTSVTTGNTVMDNSGLTVNGGVNGVVALTNNGLDNGGNAITNVAAGVNGTDGVNVAQLQAATVAGTNADERAVKYDWTDLDGDGVVDPGEVDYSKATLAGVGGTTIDNLAPGTIDASSMQAVNGSQIYANQQSLANALGGGSLVNADGTVSAPSYVTSTGTYNNVGDAIVAGNTQTNALGNSVASGLGGTSSYNPATGQLTTALTVGGTNYGDVNSALSAVNAQATAGWDVTTGATGSGIANGTSVANVAPGATHTITAGDNIIATQNGTEVQLAVNPNLNVTSVTTGNTVMDNSGLTVNGGANGVVALTNNGLDNGGNTITNVAAGVNGTDGVNVAQLQAATVAGTNADERAVKYDWTDLDGDGVVDPGEVDYSKATLAGVGGTTIDNLAPGTIDASSMQAVNGSQIYANQQSVANALGGGSLVNADGTVSAPSYVTSTGTYTNVGDAIVAGNTQINLLGNNVASGLGGTSSYNPATGQITTALTVGGTNYGDVNSALNAVNAQATAGWTVTTDATGTGQSAATLADFTVEPGENLGITAGNNMIIRQDGTDMEFALNPNLKVTSVTTGDTVMDNSGIIVRGGANGVVALTGKGLDNGGNVITDVAAGVNDTDAVNVAQLQAATVAGTNADERAVKYDWTDLDGDGVVDPGEVDYSKATLAGVGGTTIDNLAPGTIDASSMQAVNGSQIYANQQSVANALGGGSLVNADGTVSAPSYVTSTGTYNNVGDAIVAGNTQTNALGNSVASGLGGTSSYDPVTGQVTTALTVGGTNYGDVNSALSAVNAQATAGWDVTTGATGSGIANGTSVANVAPGATHTITAGDNIIATQNGTEVQLAVNPNLNVTSVTTGNTVVNNDGVTVNGGANGPVALTNNGLDNGGNTITNVAAGVNDTDAVNVAQLNQTNQQVTDLANRTDTLGDSVAAGLGGGSSYDPTTGQVTTELNVGGNSYTDVNSAINAINTTANAGWNIQANGGASSNIATNGTLNVTQGANTQVTLQGNQLQVAVVDNPTFSGMVTANGGLTVGAGQTVDMGGNVVTNVGAGAVNATSTDAVNGSQLYAASVAAQNSVQYDEGRTSVTFNPGGDAIQLHNVAAGTAPTDAVNVAQLNAGMNDAVAQANSYTDGKILSLEYDLGNARRDANAGTAGALAAAGLPQAFEPGKGLIAGGVGYYDGQTAFAIGGSRVSDDGRIIVKAGATYNTRGRAGANVGVGYQF